MRNYFKKCIATMLVVLTALLPCGIISVNADSLKMGDVDGNGDIETVDALTIQRYVVKLTDLTEAQLKVADTNGDGKVSLVDAMRILRYLAGYSSSIVDNGNNNTDDESNDFVNEVVRLVNVERAKEGLSPLTLDETLCKASAVRAEESATSFSHTRPNGSSWATVLSEYNISYMTAGENIAAGQSTPEEVVNAWMQSDGHRYNIMNADFTKIGVGYYYNSNASYRHYWEQLFVG